MNPIELLLRSRKFWLAVVAVIQTAVFALIPGFPDEVWAAINVILLWLIGTIAVEDAAKKLRITNYELRMTEATPVARRMTNDE